MLWMCIHINISIITPKVYKIEAVNLPQSYFRQTKQFCPNYQVSNFHVFYQIPVVFFLLAWDKYGFFLALHPFNPTSNNLLLTVRADMFLFAPSLSSAASSEELFLLSARDSLFKDLSSPASVDILQPCPFLFLKDIILLYLLIVDWTPFHEHSIFLAISTWEYPSQDKATICALLISESCFFGGIFN